MDCPECGTKDLWRESADVGVGIIYGPYGCDCGWSEDSKYNIQKGALKQDGSCIDQYGGIYPKDSLIAKINRGKYD